MDEKEMQQKYLELQMMDAQIKQLEKQLTTVEQQVVELQMIQKSLDELPNTKKGTDLFVPISQGIFAKAKLEENDSLLVSVGAGVVVKKTIPDAKKMLDEQLKAIKDLKANLTANMESYLMKARLIEKEIVGSQNV